MTLLPWVTTAAVMAAGSSVVVPAPAIPDDERPPPQLVTVTDPTFDPPPSGLGHEPDAQGAFDSPTVLFVNFDGPFMNAGCGNDSHQDCSVIFPNTQFDPSPSDAAKRAAIIQATREDVVDFGVIVVGERPPDSNPYAMVVVGTPAGGAPAGIGGVAPTIDCGNNNPDITSFNFLVNAGSNTQATVIHQEAAHTWGLEHVDDNTDNLFPTAGGTTDPKYQDVCSQVVSDTQLDPTTAVCNSVHTQFCEANFQNSYQEMLLLFGPPLVDQTAPTVTIDSPEDGEQIEYADDFELTITLDDDRRPQMLDTSVSFDDVEEAAVVLFDAQHTFPVNGGDPPGGHGLSNGFHTIRVDITDEAGNPASAEVTIEIVGSPFGDPDSDTGDVADNTGTGTGDGPPPSSGGGGGGAGTGVGEPSDFGGCGCRTGPAAPSGMLMLLMAAGVVRRRRRPGA